MTSTSGNRNRKQSSVKRAGVREGGWILVARLEGILIGIPAGIVNAWILGPALLGSLKVIEAFEKISLNGDLGLTKAYQREIPIYAGRGNPDQEQHSANVAFTASLIATLTQIVLLWIVYTVGFTYGGVLSGTLIVVLLSILLISARLQGVFSKRLTGAGEFVVRSRIDLAVNVLQPVLVILGVVFYGLEGILMALIFSRILYVILVVWNDRKRFHFAIDFAEIRRLLHIGISLWAVNLTNKAFVSLEILLIPLFLNLESAGIYAFAFGLVGVAGSIPVSLDQIFWRNIGIERGEEGLTDNRYMMRHLTQPVGVYSLFGAWCMGTGYLGLRMIVALALPEFAESLPLMLIITLGWIIGQQRTFAAIVLNYNDRFNTLIGLQTGLLTVNLLLDLWLISQFGVVGAAIGTGLGYAISGCIYMLVAKIVLREAGDAGILSISLRSIIAATLSTASLYVMTLGMNGWLSINGDLSFWIELLEAGVLAILYTVWVMLVFGVIFRREGLVAQVRTQLGGMYSWLLSVVRVRLRR